jgi:biotin synthase
MTVSDIIAKAADGGALSHGEIVALLRLPPGAPDAYRVLSEANRVSRSLSGNRAEVHGQFALNLSPCPEDCAFCSFAVGNGLFRESRTVTPSVARGMAGRFEADGANAVFVMTVADFDFGEFLEISQEVRRALRPETALIANVGDRTVKEALRMREAGFLGVYHALRLREGDDTRIPPERRRRSLEAFRVAGLVIGTCVEPVGPEHSNDEIAELILFAGGFDPAYSGAARRITVPGSPLAAHGMISELRMAQIVAVTRLATPWSVVGNCTHEPCTLGAIAGANLFWAESGANPRDTKADTGEGRGRDVAWCASLFRETDWAVLEGPSVFYRKERRNVCAAVQR